MDDVEKATIHLEQGRGYIRRGIWEIEPDMQSLQLYHAWGSRSDKPHIHVRYCLSRHQYEVIAKDPVNETRVYTAARPAAEYFTDLVDTRLVEEDKDAEHWALQSDFALL